MKVVSFNMNGIRAAQRRGFWDWFDQHQPDVLCIQETKSQEKERSTVQVPIGYDVQFWDAQKKGYSGVALYSRLPILKWYPTLDDDLNQQEGRWIAAELEKVNVASLYLPSGTSGDERQQKKYQMMESFTQLFLKPRIQDKKPWIICGDWNIAHQKIDLKNWKSNQNASGFLPSERAWIDEVLNLGWVDAFRHHHPNREAYTWWTYRANARANNVGWRIDYQMISPQLAPLITSATVYREPIYSDHAPLEVVYRI